MIKVDFAAWGEWLQAVHVRGIQLIMPLIIPAVGIWFSIWVPSKIDELNNLPKEDSEAYFWISHWQIVFIIGIFVLNFFGGLYCSWQTKSQADTIKEQEDRLAGYSETRDLLEESQREISLIKSQHTDMVFQVTSDYLGHISKDHLSYGFSERASLYLHDAPKHRFILAGRHSENQTLKDGPRAFFPDNEGCIGLAWENGTKYSEQFPESEDQRLQIFKDKQKFDKKDSSKLRMKSVAYSAFVITETYGGLGIVLFESTSTESLIESTLETIVEDHKIFILAMLKRTKEVNPLVNYQGEQEQE